MDNDGNRYRKKAKQYFGMFERYHIFIVTLRFNLLDVR